MKVLESFLKIELEVDLVIVEGVGSLVEINLCVGDIVNMGFVEVVDLLVILCVDIDWGGVIVFVVGIYVVFEFGE